MSGTAEKVVEEVIPEEKTLEDEQLDAALKAAEDEAKGIETTGEVGEVEKPAATAAEPGAAKTEEADAAVEVGEVQKVPEGFVPVAVMAEMRRNNSALKQENAYLIGQNQGMRMSGKPAEGEDSKAEATPAPLTLEEQMDAIDKASLELARKIDDGDISNEDAEKERIDLRKQERALLEQKSQAVAPVNQEQPLDLALEEHLTELQKTHPVLFSLNETQLKPLEELAYQQAEREGTPIQSGAIGTKDLRGRMAELATSFYGQPQTTEQVGEVQSAANAAVEQKVAKHDQKLQMAANHPADVSQMGSVTGTQAVSDEDALSRLNNMGVDEQIAYLEANPSLVQRLEDSL